MKKRRVAGGEDDVPRKKQPEQHERAPARMEPRDDRPISSDHHVGDDRRQREHEADEALGESRSGRPEIEEDPAPIASDRPRQPQQRQHEPEDEQPIGEAEASVDRRAHRRRVDETGERRAPAAEQDVSEREHQDRGAHVGQSAGKASGKFVHAERAIRELDGPVQQGRLLVVRKAVETGLDPVAAPQHLVADERVARLGKGRWPSRIRARNAATAAHRPRRQRTREASVT